MWMILWIFFIGSVMCWLLVWNDIVCCCCFCVVCCVCVWVVRFGFSICGRFGRCVSVEVDSICMMWLFWFRWNVFLISFSDLLLWWNGMIWWFGRCSILLVWLNSMFRCVLFVVMMVMWVLLWLLLFVRLRKWFRWVMGISMLCRLNRFSRWGGVSGIWVIVGGNGMIFCSVLIGSVSLKLFRWNVLNSCVVFMVGVVVRGCVFMVEVFSGSVWRCGLWIVVCGSWCWVGVCVCYWYWCGLFGCWFLLVVVVLCVCFVCWLGCKELFWLVVLCRCCWLLWFWFWYD